MRAASARRGRRAATVVIIATIMLLATAHVPARADGARVSHGIVASFDDETIAYTVLIPPTASVEAKVPIVFMTHGWGGSRTTTPTGLVKVLLDAGYAVLTWDQRGFGDSGGAAEVDAQTAEVRDVRNLIDVASRVPEVALDGPGDPRMGMVGGSYAGGIQLQTASADPRIDAIVPEITWNDLPQSLKPGGVFKIGWDTLLYASGLQAAALNGLDAPSGPQTGVYSPMLHTAFVEGNATNEWSQATYDWYFDRSPKKWIGGGVVPGVGTNAGVRVPTFVIQGANDTLFPINEAVANLRQVAANGAPTKLAFFCGGHVLDPPRSSCVPGADQTKVIHAKIVAWLDTWVRGRDVDTGAFLDYQVQDGSWASASSLPTSTISGNGSGTLVNTIAPTSGTPTSGSPGHDGFEFEVPVPDGATILGVPTARVTVTGMSAPPNNEAYLFFKLIDVDAAGKQVVIDDQVAARKITGVSATAQSFTMDLNGVSWKVLPGHKVLVEVTPTSLDHATSRVPWRVEVSATASLPLVDAAVEDPNGADVAAPATTAPIAELPRSLPATGAPFSLPLLAPALALVGATMLRRLRIHAGRVETR